MNREFLSNLICPHCGKGLTVATILTSSDEESLRDAVVTCECSMYPIVEGILVLNRTTNTRMAVDLLLRKKPRHALVALMNPYGSEVSHHLIERSHQRRTFFELIDLLQWGNWGDYLKYRFSSPTLLIVAPFLRFFSSTQKLVLDVGCGAGHLSFILSKVISGDRIVGIDQNFVSLLLAKLKIMKGANYICLDANDLLPFKDHIFSIAVSLDAFHYMDSKSLLVSELARSLDPSGIVLLLHLHNSLQFNVSAGKSLSSAQYLRLFRDMTCSIFPERWILQSFVTNNELDLSRKFRSQEVNKSDALALIASKTRMRRLKLTNVTLEFMKQVGDIVINPLYMKPIRSGNRIRLNLKFPSKTYGNEYGSYYGSYLPISFDIDFDIWKLLKTNGTSLSASMHAMGPCGKIDPSEFRYFIRNLLLIDVPKGYLKNVNQ